MTGQFGKNTSISYPCTLPRRETPPFQPNKKQGAAASGATKEYDPSHRTNTYVCVQSKP